jgi:L-lactate dehydrogenase complex protein LldF
MSEVHATQWNRREFPEAARDLLQNSQTRKNVQHATSVIQAKRNKVVAELPDWEDLREAGAQIRAHTLRHLDHYLIQFEANCTRAGGHVHWAVRRGRCAPHHSRTGPTA